MRKHRIVLYNPRAPFFTMPLALMAVGSALDRARYDVRIVDGRLARDPVARVLEATEDALCLGVSVLTGSPIRDALAITRAVRARRPGCRIVWGGWHPSLSPADTLKEAGVDAVVVGQGEQAFAGLVERFAAGETAGGIVGPQATHDINSFPAHDYGLIDVERHFALKGGRQLDYVTSQGCRFRCTFCSDPTVYGRAWFGLEQDETFFTHTSRVAAIAEEIRRRDLHFTWMATMRGDQGARLDESVLLACRQSGLRRVMIGLESGSQAMLDWMKKDLKLEQVFVTAEKCRRYDIAVLFSLIRFGFYQRIGWAKPTAWRAPLQAVARWRCRRDAYAFPIEKAIVEWVRQVHA